MPTGDVPKAWTLKVRKTTACQARFFMHFFDKTQGALLVTAASNDIYVLFWGSRQLWGTSSGSGTPDLHIVGIHGYPSIHPSVSI